MDKSPKSAKLEEYARGLENAYDDFVRAMGFLPQRKGVDRGLRAYVEENDPSHDELMCQYVILTGLYKGDLDARELMHALKAERES